ncbi:MAG: tRNA (adenosine(37)-N6)-threonylcarbamoyltransferase complex ATPase subunit type 1 TsaE [Candidatus Celaenobacter antarcticus]|nr:tRNA (adenosine(37)-N6)-threonylcarbamoyltransferase complex ATPase subunit type 1 TsaE [Candidatus Celaenobacter antarcticus]
MARDSYSSEFISTSENETSRIAKDFADLLKIGDVVALKGELGSGKTFFVKKIAEELGFDGYVSSPTFTILNIYEASTYLYHFDFYRLKNVEEIEKIGFCDLLMEEGIFFIEWPEKAEGLLPEEYFEVRIDIVNATHRNLSIKKIAGNKEVKCQN